MALLLGGLSGGFSGGSGSGSSSAAPAGAVTAPAPPNAQAQEANCTKVLEKLPVTLGTLAPRTVHTTPSTPFVVAWGDPAIVFSCGVAKPKDLHPGSGVEFVGPSSGPFFDVTKSGDANVFTTVDRGPYIAITVPAKYQGADYLPLLYAPIGQALPAVCSTDSGVADPAKLCTRRTS